MIFTGQAWNMTFSFYHSLQLVPADQQEAATVYRFNWWQRLKWVELPFSTMGLVWNSMMSMAGGWFFLMISEAFKLGDKDFRLPGLGSYMSVAVEQGRVDAMLWAMLAMILMIVALDQLLWRPVVVWAQKFRVEEGGEQPMMSSWFLNWLRRSRLMPPSAALIHRERSKATSLRQAMSQAARRSTPLRSSSMAGGSLSRFLCFSLAILAYGAWQLVLPACAKFPLAALGRDFRRRSSPPSPACWRRPRRAPSGRCPPVWPSGFRRGCRGSSSRWCRSPPRSPRRCSSRSSSLSCSMAGVSLNFGCILLMLLGTQWYILFNVIAGAMAIPADLRETARSYRLSLAGSASGSSICPPCFPYLVTGWVTAAGGAWNASIVAEYVTFQGEILETRGLGARSAKPRSHADFPLLAASVLVMAVMVVHLQPPRLAAYCTRLAEHRYSLSK